MVGSGWQHKPPSTTSAPSCIRFTYDPNATPPLTENFECGGAYYSNDVALLSDGTVVAATYVDATTVKLQLFDTDEVWATTITDDVYAHSCKGRGLEVDSSRQHLLLGTQRREQHHDSAPRYGRRQHFIPNFEPNGLLIAFNSDGSTSGRALMLQAHRREPPQ